jgi:hypothetical protein
MNAEQEGNHGSIVNGFYSTLRTPHSALEKVPAGVAVQSPLPGPGYKTRSLRGELVFTNRGIDQIAKHLSGRDALFVGGIFESGGLPARKQQGQLDNVAIDRGHFRSPKGRGRETNRHRTNHVHGSSAREAFIGPPDPASMTEGAFCFSESWRANSDSASSRGVRIPNARKRDPPVRGDRSSSDAPSQ